MLILDGSVSMTIGEETQEMRAGDVCVVNRGVEHELHSADGVTFVEALGPVPLDHIPDRERDLVLGDLGGRSHARRRPLHDGDVRASCTAPGTAPGAGSGSSRELERARSSCGRDRPPDRGSGRGPRPTRRARRRGPARGRRRRDPRRALDGGLDDPARRPPPASSAPRLPLLPRPAAGREASPTATRRRTSTCRASSGTRCCATTEPRTGPTRRRQCGASTTTAPPRTRRGRSPGCAPSPRRRDSSRGPLDALPGRRAHLDRLPRRARHRAGVVADDVARASRGRADRARRRSLPVPLTAR